MAGIGFELRKMLRGDSFLSDMSAYLYAAMVSSGPWLMSVLCLAVLGLYSYSGFPGWIRIFFGLPLFMSMLFHSSMWAISNLW